MSPGGMLRGIALLSNPRGAAAAAAPHSDEPAQARALLIGCEVQDVYRDPETGALVLVLTGEETGTLYAAVMAREASADSGALSCLQWRAGECDAVTLK